MRRSLRQVAEHHLIHPLPSHHRPATPTYVLAKRLHTASLPPISQPGSSASTLTTTFLPLTPLTRRMPGATRTPNTLSPASKAFHGYLSSSLLAGDPNTHRCPGCLEWSAYDPAGYGAGTAPGQQLVVQPGPKSNGSATQLEADVILARRYLG